MYADVNGYRFGYSYSLSPTPNRAVIDGREMG